MYTRAILLTYLCEFVMLDAFLFFNGKRYQHNKGNKIDLRKIRINQFNSMMVIVQQNNNLVIYNQ